MWLLPVASLTVLINGFRSTAWITVQRHLNIKIMSLVRAGVAVLRIAAMAVIAWFSPTAWALVGGLVINALLLCVASHYMIPAIKNRFHFEREAFWSLIKYGRWLFLSTVITFFAGQLDKLLLGSLISVSALGVFYIGARFAELAPMFFKQIGGMVGFPALSDVYRRDEERFKVVLLKMRVVLTLPINLFLLGMIATGPMITWFFYAGSPTPSFIEAGWIIQVLCFNSMAGMVTTSYGHVFMASGRTMFNMISVAVQLVVMVVCLTIGLPLRRGDGLHHGDRRDPVGQVCLPTRRWPRPAACGSGSSTSRCWSAARCWPTGRCWMSEWLAGGLCYESNASRDLGAHDRLQRASGTSRETVRACWARRFKNFEFVVVDDGSTDRTAGDPRGVRDRATRGSG